MKALKILAVIIAVLLVVAIALPFVIDVNSFRPKLETELTAALGRDVKVGNLKLSILSGSVTAEDLSIADDPSFSKDAFIKAKSLGVGVEVMPLIFSKILHVTHLTLDEPQISLLRSEKGTWNFSSIGGGSKAAGQQPAKQAPSDSPTNLSVSKLNVNDGRISVGRAGSSIKPHSYEKVNIEVRDFSFASQFPFTITANLPGGGNLKLAGTAGPIDPADASLTPFDAKITVHNFDLDASGFVDPASGVAGVADFDGTLASDGKTIHSNGTAVANKLKLSPKGSPAGRPVQLKYGLESNLQKEAGTLTEGDITIGKALAQLTGTYQMQGPTTLLNMKLYAQGMPVDDLEAMLPPLGVVLPSGSSLKGGTLSTTLSITGPTDKLIITGPVRMADTKLAGFDLGSKMSAISALGGTRTGSDTSIQNLSTNARVAPDGIRTDNVNLTIPALGTVTGAGTISPAGALNYKLNAALSGGAVSGISQMAGLGGGGASIPFMVQGTTSNPQFVPDVQGMLGSQLKSRLGGLNGKDAGKGSPLDALGGLFGKKKKSK